MNEYLLFKNLVKNTLLESNEILNIISKSKSIQLKKGDEWPVKSFNNTELGFVSNGILGLFNKTYPNQILSISRENQWITSISSLHVFNSVEKNEFNNTYFYKSFEKSTIFTFSKMDFEDIIQAYPSFQKFVLDIHKSSYLNALEHFSLCSSLDAEQRYLYWIKKESELSQRLPQYLIASFLNLLPTSLSRIRKQLFRK